MSSTKVVLPSRPVRRPVRNGPESRTPVSSGDPGNGGRAELDHAAGEQGRTQSGCDASRQLIGRAQHPNAERGGRNDPRPVAFDGGEDEAAQRQGSQELGFEAEMAVFGV